MSYFTSIKKPQAPFYLVYAAGILLLSACSKSQRDEPVEELNQPPQVMSQAFTTQTELVIMGKLEANDPENQALSFTLIQAPALGQLALDKNGGFSYTPDAEITGNDSFIFSVSDGVNPAVSARADITIETLRLNLSSFSRDAFSRQSGELPLSLNGRVFIDDIGSSDFYADLFAF